METFVAVVGVTGFGLMTWAVVFAVRQRSQDSQAVSQGFWRRFVIGYVATLVALILDPAESADGVVAGYIVLTGLGLMVWGVVFGVRRFGQWNKAITWGFAGRFGVGLVAFTVAMAFVPDVEPARAPVEQLQAAPTSEAPSTPSVSPAPPVTMPARNVPDGVPDDAQKAVVLRVDTGDAVQLTATEPGSPLPESNPADVRLLHIRSPQPGQCLNDESTEHLSQLASVGESVWVQEDQESQDAQGRHLLYVWNESGVFVNVDMVAKGFAEPQFMAPNSLRWADISEAGDQARASEAGFWEHCAYFGATEVTSSAQPSPEPEPKPKPQPQPQPDPSPRDGGNDDEGGSAYYKNCSAAKAAGAAPLYAGQPGYSSDLDRDGDGVACES